MATAGRPILSTDPSPAAPSAYSSQTCDRAIGECSVIPSGWRPSRIASTMWGASCASRSGRETQGELIFAAAANSSIVLWWPASIIRRRRNARATSFTNVVSPATAPRGAIPPGVSTSFRPPRCFRTASGTRTVCICAAPLTLLLSPVRRALPGPARGWPAPPASAAPPPRLRPPGCVRSEGVNRRFSDEVEQGDVGLRFSAGEVAGDQGEVQPFLAIVGGAAL